MKKLNTLLCFVYLFPALYFFHCFGQEDINQASQMLVVLTPSWDTHQGFLNLYERDASNRWNSIGDPIPVVVGRKGLGWGIGKHQLTDLSGPVKAEGDGKAPAGIFSLGTAFGFASPKEIFPPLKMDYMPLNKDIEAVDDVASNYYNCIVDNKTIQNKDWKSSEKMAEQPLYKLGFAVNHNFPNPEKGAGSAIFFHIWEGADVGTSGCTAMNEAHLVKVLSWLDKSKNPVLIQLTMPMYQKLKMDWQLP